jgi:hypothetical protein
MEQNKSISSGTYPPSTLWIGLALIVAGTVILVNQMSILPFKLNWWGLLVLFPAVGTLSSAYKRYRSTNDVFDMGVMVPALVGLFMLFMAVSLFAGSAIDLQLRVYWPVILIVLGLGMILGRMRRS